MLKSSENKRFGCGAQKTLAGAILLTIDDNDPKDVFTLIATENKNNKQTSLTLKKEYDTTKLLHKKNVNVVCPLGYCEHTKPGKHKKNYMLVEYCDGDSLFSYLQSNPINSVQDVTNLIYITNDSLRNK